MKNTNSKKLAEDLGLFEDLTIEELIKQLEDIELQISQGELSISEQIAKIGEAKSIFQSIKKKLSEAKAQINIIES